MKLAFLSASSRAAVLLLGLAACAVETPERSSPSSGSDGAEQPRSTVEPSPPAGHATAWETSTARGVVEITRTGTTGVIVASFVREPQAVGARAPLGTCAVGTPPTPAPDLVDIGELGVSAPGRGQGIIIRPDAKQKYVADLPEEIVRAPFLSLVAVRAVGDVTVLHDVELPSFAPVETLRARRIAADEVELAWQPISERMLMVSARGAAGSVVASCTFAGSDGRGRLHVGGASSLRAAFVASSSSTASGVRVEVHDARELSL